MTVLVGILCSDGVVIGADSCATLGDGDKSVAEQPAIKIDVVKDRIIVATTGEVGLAQRLVERVEHLHHLFRDKKPGEAAVAFVADLRANFDATGAWSELVQRAPDGKRELIQRVYGIGALLGFEHRGAPVLLELAVHSLQPEFKGGHISCFCSMGSGAQFAEPFLGFERRVFKPEGAEDLWTPKLATGTFLATMALDHVIDVNTGGVDGPMQIATLRDTGNGVWRARVLSKDDMGEPLQLLDEAYRHMGGFQRVFDAKGKKDLPV
jgi:20S proteasome alpha/beta subunit